MGGWLGGWACGWVAGWAGGWVQCSPHGMLEEYRQAGRVLNLHPTYLERQAELLITHPPPTHPPTHLEWQA